MRISCIKYILMLILHVSVLFVLSSGNFIPKFETY
jgi:hypothetical protein